ncbi:DnaA regulatory inactivator Hda [Methylococcus sp. EFPC2]|uniref:DnaA regulatory inactivator Hda n=1 Tax=Methylococcus sp. EFPC2 TaxID=2812648 RepID=UPI00196852AB|nr:DnaA regulatory inactivator Hda [Methylococcus sp. EFPC2]QSA97437.1 DnaA regulatory inactivator Hda [Methylococcus sp. EFPC2]
MSLPRQLPLRLAFNPRHGFAEYHAGANAEVVDHLRRCASGTGESFIFLHGDSGSGKTHLLHACCGEAQQHDASVFYLPLAELADHGAGMLEGLERQTLVCLDDIEAIATRNEWEHGLFDLFNRLRDAGHRLIVSSHLAPAELPIALPDLLTRLNWGLTLRLRPLDDDDLLAALALQAQSLGLELPAPVGRFLLNHCRRDPAHLRRHLEQLDTATLAAKRKLTIPFLKTYLEENP